MICARGVYLRKMLAKFSEFNLPNFRKMNKWSQIGVLPSTIRTYIAQRSVRKRRYSGHYIQWLNRIDSAVRHSESYANDAHNVNGNVKCMHTSLAHMMLIVCGLECTMYMAKNHFFDSGNRQYVDKDDAWAVTVVLFIKSFLNMLRATYAFLSAIQKNVPIRICLLPLIFPFRLDNIIFFVANLVK